MPREEENPGLQDPATYQRKLLSNTSQFVQNFHGQTEHLTTVGQFQQSCSGLFNSPRHSEMPAQLILRILNISLNATKSSCITFEVLLPGRLTYLFMRPTLWIILEEPVCFRKSWRLVFLTSNLKSLTNNSVEHQWKQHHDEACAATIRREWSRQEEKYLKISMVICFFKPESFNLFSWESSGLWIR